MKLYAEITNDPCGGKAKGMGDNAFLGISLAHGNKLLGRVLLRMDGESPTIDYFPVSDRKLKKGKFSLYPQKVKD